MKKAIRSMVVRFGFASLLLIGLLVSVGCKGKDGKSYQAYYWASTPQYFSDSNPSTPSTVYSGSYYRTDSGTYYLGYIAWNGSAYYGYYTITRNEGKTLQDGDDLWFEIDLLSTGPVLYKYTSARSLDGHTDDSTPKDAQVTGVTLSKQMPQGTQGPELGSDIYRSAAGTVELHYGKIIPNN